MDIKATNSGASTYHWVSCSRDYRVATWARVSTEELLKILVWIKPLHCCAKWFSVIEILSHCAALLTSKGCRPAHFWIIARVVLEVTHPTTLYITVLRSMKYSVSWLWCWDPSLLIDNDSYCATRYGWNACIAVDKMGNYLCFKCWSSHCLFGVSRWESGSSRLNWLIRWYFLVVIVPLHHHHCTVFYCVRVLAELSIWPSHHHNLSCVLSRWLSISESATCDIVQGWIHARWYSPVSCRK